MATTETITCRAFGVGIAIVVPARLSEHLPDVVPPTAETGAGDGQVVSIVLAESGGRFKVTVDGAPAGVGDGEESALGTLGAQVRAQVALLAPDHIFVHAAVVGVGGRAVIMPGSSFAGKTTLAQALVEAGAVYYSDEFAVLDPRGMVHPYPKPLSVRHRDGSGRARELSATALGGVAGGEPIPAGLIAVTSYRAGATVRPQPLAPGPAALALLAHTIPARTRPRQSLAAVTAAVQTAVAWTSDRGEAGPAAQAIVDSLS